MTKKAKDLQVGDKTVNFGVIKRIYRDGDGGGIDGIVIRTVTNRVGQYHLHDLSEDLDVEVEPNKIQAAYVTPGMVVDIKEPGETPVVLKVVHTWTEGRCTHIAGKRADMAKIYVTCYSETIVTVLEP